MATIQAHVPDDIQDAANAIIQSAGLSPADAVCMWMTRIAEAGVLPLDLFQPSAETAQAIGDAQTGNIEKTTINEILQAIDDDRANR